MEEENAPAVEITIPKRKDEIEAEKNLAAKKAFARQLASLYSTLKKEDSDRYIRVGNTLRRFFEDISFSRTNSNGTYRVKL